MGKHISWGAYTEATMYRATRVEAMAALAYFEPKFAKAIEAHEAAIVQRQADSAAEAAFHQTYTSEQRWNDPAVYALYNEMMKRHKKNESTLRKNQLDRARLMCVVCDLRIARDR